MKRIAHVLEDLLPAKRHTHRIFKALEPALARDLAYQRQPFFEGDPLIFKSGVVVRFKPIALRRNA